MRLTSVVCILLYVASVNWVLSVNAFSKILALKVTVLIVHWTLWELNESFLAWNISKWLELWWFLKHTALCKRSKWGKKLKRGQFHMHYWSISACFRFFCWPSCQKRLECLAAWTFFGSVTIDQKRRVIVHMFVRSEIKDLIMLIKSFVDLPFLSDPFPALKHWIEKLFSAWKYANLIYTLTLYCFSCTESLFSLSFKCWSRI